MVDVFVSYAHSDRQSAQAISVALKAAGLDVWIDSRLINSGDDFGDEMLTALAEARIIVLLISAASLKSQWAQLEWGAALARSREAGVTLLPVLLDDSKLPSHLSRLHLIDGRNLSLEELGSKMLFLVSHLPDARMKQIA